MGNLFLLSAYRHLMDEDETFSSWVENIARGSKINAETSLRRIGRACLLFGITPRSLAKMERGEAGAFLLKAVSRFEGEGLRSSSIAGYVKTMKSWWRFNDVEVTRQVRYSRDTGLYDNERVPTRQELNSVFEHADLQKKVLCALMAFSGVRPGVLGNRFSDDGLRVSDLPELVVEGGKVRFLRVPATVVVRRTISKSGRQYFTFLPEQGCGYVREYLEWRGRTLEERIDASSPIATANPHNPRSIGSHVRTNNISDSIRFAIRAAGFSWRPYVLRRYFDTRMMGAEQEGHVIRDYRTFWMGHIGDIEHVYTLNKGELPQDLLEGMRQAYARAAEKHLETVVQPTIDKGEVVSTARVEALKMFGYSDEEVKALGNVSELDMDRLQELIQQKSKRMLGLNGGTQKVVPVAELETWIEQGWDYKRDLPNGRAVVGLRTE
ncbi:MAG: site-specific integrase [Nitrososphaerota archaeon]|nr:site-specific integrase [Nitrososphaerota archaeon]MDG7023698.1 site-specific integrase [Nitrososphaerota archaeon]